MMIMHTRRRVLHGVAATGAALIAAPRAFAADEQLETTAVRLTKIPLICPIPEYIVTEFLQAEGFTDVRFVSLGSGAEVNGTIARGAADFCANSAEILAAGIDAGERISVLAGIHGGCYELFANERVRSVAELKGKNVGVVALGSPQHLFVAALAAHIGINPARDIRWVPGPQLIESFAQGKIDALMAVPPISQDLRARKVGHVILNSGIDAPWSQYFCCMIAGNREFARANPVATKRVLRAILKAADLCASDPDRAAGPLVDGGFIERYDYARQTLNEIAYNRWRDHDGDDTLRFYALRLHEAGLIKSTPQKIIAEGTNWRFLNELKRELSA
jgi:NitT/TauT family transport system substrate-binding protein